MESASTFQLPVEIISPTDIARLVRELENLDEFFRQMVIRQGAATSVPRYSRLLDTLVSLNGTNLLQQGDRNSLLEFLRGLNTVAPVMHISFSTDPPGQYVQKIVGWLRTNIHPLVLVQVGLQPTIGAGCIVRTQNHSFDFSLRRFFDEKHDFFMKKLHDAVAPTPQESAMQNAQNTAALDIQELGEKTLVEVEASVGAHQPQTIEALESEIGAHQETSTEVISEGIPSQNSVDVGEQIVVTVGSVPPVVEAPQQLIQVLDQSNEAIPTAGLQAAPMQSPGKVQG